MNDSHTTVLVVGAGPTGLTTAIELARRGVGLRIVEKRSEPSIRSKALVVHARTLELLDILGIADDLVARGYTSPGIDFSANAERPLRANMYGIDTRFPYILIVPQAVTEEVLERRLNEEGVFVERSSELTGFVETDNGFSATIVEEGDESKELTANYVVGADGPHSTIRDTLKIPFPGAKYEWTAFLGDCHLDGHHAEGGTEQHSNNRGLAFIVPFDDGSHRIVTIDHKYQGGPKRGDLSLGELQESISAILEKPVNLRAPKWLTRWGADLRLAPEYRKGKTFIAGDAAHTHSPAGGQGMNTGIQDAFNLGWKLALVLQGQAPESLLEGYHQERHAIGEQVIRLSDFLLRSLLLRNVILRTLRQMLFRVILPLSFVQKKLATNLSGLGIEYPKDTAGPLAGKRIPDVQLRTADQDFVRLYELLRFPGYSLLVFVDPEQARTRRSEIDHLGELSNDVLNVHVIMNNGLPKLHDFPVNALVDYRGDFEAKVGAKTGRMILVRPDAYVAVDQGRLDVTNLVPALEPWLQEIESRSRESTRERVQS